MSNELYHWKYLKREKVGNKWKYYYDTSSLKNDIKKSFDSGKDAKARMYEAKSKLDAATAKRNDAVNAETKAYAESKIGENIRNHTTMRKAQIDSENKASYYKQQSHKESLRTMPRVSKQLEYNSKAVTNEQAAELAKVGVEYYQKRIDKDVDKLSPYREKSAAATKELIKAAEEYTKTQEEYFKTPLGRLDKAKESITKARDYVYELFDDSYESRAKRAARRKRRQLRR